MRRLVGIDQVHKRILEVLVHDDASGKQHYYISMYITPPPENFRTESDKINMGSDPRTVKLCMAHRSPVVG